MFFSLSLQRMSVSLISFLSPFLLLSHLFFSLLPSLQDTLQLFFVLLFSSLHDSSSHSSVSRTHFLIQSHHAWLERPHSISDENSNSSRVTSWKTTLHLRWRFVSRYFFFSIFSPLSTLLFLYFTEWSIKEEKIHIYFQWERRKKKEEEKSRWTEETDCFIYTILVIDYSMSIWVEWSSELPLLSTDSSYFSFFSSFSSFFQNPGADGWCNKSCNSQSQSSRKRITNPGYRNVNDLFTTFPPSSFIPLPRLVFLAKILLLTTILPARSFASPCHYSNTNTQIDSRDLFETNIDSYFWYTMFT